MAGTELEDQLRAFDKVYSFKEAIDEMKRRDLKFTDNPIHWVDVKTGKEVVLGYNR